MASEKSKILVVGATGYLGRHVVAASARLGHPTLALVRDTAPADPAKAALLKSFQDAGCRSSRATWRQGRRRGHLHRRGAADRRPDTAHRRHQGGRQRQEVLPVGVRPGRRPHGRRGSAQVPDHQPQGGAPPRRRGRRRPLHVRVDWLLLRLQPARHRAGLVPVTPVDKPAVVLGDGDSKVSNVDEGDIGTYVVMAADDPRAENRTLYIRPPVNTVSHNELLARWERKTGRALERVHLDEDAVLKQIRDPIPLNSILLSIGHAVHIKREHEFEIDPAKGVDASELYPDVKYTTVDEYLYRFL